MSTLTVQNLRGVSPTNQITVANGHKLYAPGCIIQVQQNALYTRQVYGNADFWQVISGFNVTITPISTSSKVLLSCHFPCSTGPDTSSAFRWARNGNYLPYGTGYSTDRDAHFKQASYNHGSWQYTTSHELLDSPQSTSALTYQIWFRAYDGSRTFYFNGASDGSANADRAYCVATITAKEVAA